MMLVIQAASLSSIRNSTWVASGAFAGPQMLFKGLVELLGRKPPQARFRPGQWHSMRFWLAGPKKGQILQKGRVEVIWNIWEFFWLFA